MDKIEELNKIINNSNNIVFFGGAGVSTESGIPDFRSVDGLYNQKYKYRPEEIISHTFFVEKPKDFYAFYREKMIYPNAKPNEAHKKLAYLEKEGKIKAIITQNIDNLHQQAGSKEVYELHGSVYRNFCVKCHRAYDINYILKTNDIPICSCGGIIKPDVVLYEEGLDEGIIKKSIIAISSCDTLIVGGTSLTVYPAAGLIRYFKGKNLVLINKSSTPYDMLANLIINENINEVFKKIK